MTTGAADDLKVHRLQPLRVLLSGRDRRFIRVTSFLLTQRGYEVADSNPRRTLEAVELHRPDVVLVEATSSRVMAARKVAAIQALSTAPSVVLLFDDHEQNGWRGLPGVRKWSSVDALVDEIEAAALNRPAPFTDDPRTRP